jgi:transcription initiation factor IIF auxiliary subunit
MKSTILILAAVLLLQNCPPADAQENITVSNTAKFIGDGRWDWTVFVIAERPVLDRIQCVEYTLHPTFPNPIRRVCTPGDPSHAFALSANGWGTFTIKVHVIFRDKSVQQLQYNLVLK